MADILLYDENIRMISFSIQQGKEKNRELLPNFGKYVAFSFLSLT